MKVLIGSDKISFSLKEALKAWLQEQGHEMVDIGTHDPENAPMNYPAVGAEGGRRVSQGEFERAVLICGSGMGVAQIANKFRGVRAAVVEGLYTAKMCRMINDSNILCLGSRVLPLDHAIEITRLFFDTDFAQGSPPLAKMKEEFLELEATAYR